MKDWKNISKQIESLTNKDLVRLVRDLYATNDDNSKFLAARFLKDKASTKKYKDQIRAAIYPDYNYGNSDVRIRDAKKAISEFEKATHNPRQTLDLMIYFLEVGTEAMEAFGMDYEEFFDSMESMFRRVFTRLKGKDQKLLPVFLKRLRHLEQASRDTGYGYGDSLADMMEDLGESARRQGSAEAANAT